MKKKMETSKKLAIAIIVIALIDIQLPFILAFMGRDVIAETLALTICTEIVGVYAAYCVKAFKGKKEEMKNQEEDDGLN